MFNDGKVTYNGYTVSRTVLVQSESGLINSVNVRECHSVTDNYCMQVYYRCDASNSTYYIHTMGSMNAITSYPMGRDDSFPTRIISLPKDYFVTGSFTL